MEKPNKEKYGWHSKCGSNDEPTGWLIEGGEEAYYEALKRYEFMEAKGLCEPVTDNSANTMSNTIFSLSEYLKSKGFKRLNRNQSHPADCKHKYKFIHNDSRIRIVMWDCELMSVGNNPSEFVIPNSENEFLEILKDVEPTLLAFLNSN